MCIQLIKQQNKASASLSQRPFWPSCSLSYRVWPPLHAFPYVRTNFILHNFNGDEIINSIDRKQRRIKQKVGNNNYNIAMMLSRRIIVTLSLLANITGSSYAFTSLPTYPSLQRTISATTTSSQVFADAPTQQTSSVGNSHGQGSCFLPLLQNDEEYIAPRIVQVSLKNKKLV